MKITIDDIRQRFDALHLGSESRESIAHFALRAMQANDTHSLEMQPASSRGKIWKAIKYLSGVDLKESPDRYLHSNENFVDFRKRLGI